MLHFAVLVVTGSPFELRSLALAVIVAPTCRDGDGAVTMTVVTVVSDGPVGPSLHATSAKPTATNIAAFFMSTLPRAK